MTDLPVVPHYIAGAERPSSSGRTAPVFDPAVGTESKRVALADKTEIDEAIAAAQAAFPGWRDLSITKRQQIIFRFRELLNERKDELALILTSEHGKVVSDALGEITRGLEVVELASGFPHIIKGEYSANVSTGVDVYSTKAPLGVVGVISPFNFPAMVPMWFFPIAIAAGNTVVLKPSEKDPSAANWLAALFTEAGLPDGVLNVLHGDKEAVDGLLEHPDVKAISFVGSTPIAKYIYETAARNGKRVQALGGAKNHMLVLPDADLELTADAAINAGFGSAGERCMAISVIVAVEPVADELIEKIESRMSTLTVGDGRRSCDMGPLITEVHRDKVASYIDFGHRGWRHRRRRWSRCEGRRRVRRLLARTDPDRQRARHLTRVPRRDLRPGAVDRAGEDLPGGSRPHQQRRLRQRHGDLHQRRRSRPQVPERGGGRDDRHQRAHPGSGCLPLVRWLQGLDLRVVEGLRHPGLRFLHPREGDHQPLARPVTRWHQPRIPAELSHRWSSLSRPARVSLVEPVETRARLAGRACRDPRASRWSSLSRPARRTNARDLSMPEENSEDDGGMLVSAPAIVHLYPVPGADFPAWAPFAFGLVGLATLAVLIYQAVRYFRNNRDD